MYPLVNILKHSHSGINRITCQILYNRRLCNLSSQDPLLKEFHNKSIFSKKTTPEILRALCVFGSCSIESLVDNQEKVMDVCRKIMGEKLFDFIMRMTFFGHFVAGENVESVKMFIKKLEAGGVGGIIDYAVESDLSMLTEDKFDIKTPYRLEDVAGKTLSDRYLAVAKACRTLRPPVDSDSFSWKLTAFLESIKLTAESKLGSFVAIKVTALINPPTLLQINKYIDKMREIFDRHASTTGEMKLEDFSKAVTELQLCSNQEDISPLFRMADTCAQNHLSWYDWISFFHPLVYHRDVFKRCPEFFPSQQQWWECVLMMTRVYQIVHLSCALNVRIMVDAEQSYFQSAIHLFTVEMQREGNQKLPMIYNTYQCYLTKTDRNLQEDMRFAEKCSTPFYLAAKCVRGAYINRETIYSQETGKEYPIHPNYEATSLCFDRSVSNMIEGVSKGKTAVCMATHNENSVVLAIKKIKSLQLDPRHRDLSFGQLLGMFDHLTFGLARMEYNAYKYLPYGPVKDVMPYLARRAVENKSIMKKTSSEISILCSELIARLTFQKS